jgi:hypothetical protein
MLLTVRISNTLLHVVEGLPSEVVVEKTVPLTISQLAIELKIPTILIAIAVVDGVKRPLDFRLTQNAEITFIGPIAGG